MATSPACGESMFFVRLGILMADAPLQSQQTLAAGVLAMMVVTGPARFRGRHQSIAIKRRILGGGDPINTITAWRTKVVVENPLWLQTNNFPEIGFKGAAAHFSKTVHVHHDVKLRQVQVGECPVWKE